MKKDNELLEASRTGNISLVEKLLSPTTSNPWSLSSLGFKGRVSVSCRDHSGYTPLHHAALNGHKNVVCILLQNSASANVYDNKGNFPLHLAAWSGFSDIIYVLLTHGPSIAKINEQNGDSETALHCAAQHGHSEAVKILLKEGADPTICNIRGESPLDLASQYGRLDVVRLLLFHEPSLLKIFPDCFSPLHVASRNGHKEIVELLIAHGADVNKNGDNGSPLHEAALFGKLDVVKLLLNRGANPHAVDLQNRTPLELVRHLRTRTAQEISQLILDRLQDGDDYVPISPVANPTLTHANLKNFIRRSASGHNKGNPARSPINIEEHLMTSGIDQSSPSLPLRRSHTIKGLSRGLSRFGAKTIGLRKTASVRNSKSLPRLPSSHSPTSTSPCPRLSSRQFHPSSNMFPVSPTRTKNEDTSLSVLSLPAAVSSNAFTSSGENRRSRCTLISDTDSVFYSRPPNRPSSRKESFQKHFLEKTDRISTVLPSKVLPSTEVKTDFKIDYENTHSYANTKLISSSTFNDPCSHTASLSSLTTIQPQVVQKPKKPARQKHSTVTSPPPLPPKPIGLYDTDDFFLSRRPPSPTNPPPIDDDLHFSDTDSSENVNNEVNEDVMTIEAAAPRRGSLSDDIEQCAEILVSSTCDREKTQEYPRFSPPSPHSAMLQVSATLQSALSHHSKRPSVNDMMIHHGGDISTFNSDYHCNKEDSSFEELQCFPKLSDTIKSEFNQVSVKEPVPNSNVSTAPDVLNDGLISSSTSEVGRDGCGLSNSELSLLAPAPPTTTCAIFPPLTETFPSTSAQDRISPSSTPPLKIEDDVKSKTLTSVDASNLSRSSVDEISSNGTSEWDDDLSDRTEDMLIPQKLQKFRGLTRGSCLKQSKQSSHLNPLLKIPVKYIDDSDSASSEDQMLVRTSDSQKVFDKKIPPAAANETSEDGGKTLPDLDTIKNTVAAVRSTKPQTNFRATGTTLFEPQEDVDEWKEIAKVMSSVGGDMKRGEIYTKQFEDTFWKIMTGSTSPRSISSWLNDLELSRYEEILVGNGFDDVMFLNGGILSDTDLMDMNITNPCHRKKILGSLPYLPTPTFSCSNSTSQLLLLWLSDLKLMEYENCFLSAGYRTIEQVRGLDEWKLQKIIRKRGHVNRATASLKTLALTSPTSLTPQSQLVKSSVEEKEVEVKGRSVYDRAAKRRNLPASDSSKYLENISRSSSFETSKLLTTTDKVDHNKLKFPYKSEVSLFEGSNLVSPVGSSFLKQRNSAMNVCPPLPTPERAIFLSTQPEGLNLRPPNEATHEVKVSAWRHPQAELISGSCNYQAYYLGSMLIRELRGVESTKEACLKMKKSTDAMKKIPCITLSIKYSGVKFIDFKSKHEIAEHEIQNISLASQDAADLSTFAYITCDNKTGHHYCHVFRVTTMDMAYEVILTLGQAFEIAYQLIMKERLLQ